MMMRLDAFVNLYFNDSVKDYAKFCGSNYKSCARHIADPRMYVEVTPSGIRRYKLEQDLPPRAYDVRYDHFNPYFIKFSFCGVSYSLLQSGASYLLKSLELGDTDLPLEVVVQKPEMCAFTSFVFRVKETNNPVLEVLTDTHGSFVILHSPHNYVFLRQGEVVSDLTASSFDKAIRVCVTEGVELRLNRTLIFNGGMTF
ncbi:hypothetical protein VIBNISOn1_530006 [Vibrio nigripulchritudo SOn1]|uniref:VWFD domain-containing protein n=1 Tax=Vibrio nigripulchritudo SOn1 TaxID=1238450 RepID=A0AAV2VUT4_9VIBR|nr:hypothetical protein [Vibrio nigripulchritudo]CCO48437.1 hypothetical protein VIBNISOn1_530006 [Vibrio nigripulchritudo SOn1]